MSINNSKAAEITIIDICSSSDEEDEGVLYHLRRGRFRKNTPMKDENKSSKSKFEIYDEDCFILDSDPFQSIDISTMLSITNDHNDEDISIVSEKGQVACRDFPHSRHLCANFPFNATPHLSYCSQCYCYVCDSAAPCQFWTEVSGSHCNATDKHEGWVTKRNNARPTPAPR